jgi:hypothetical protein
MSTPQTQTGGHWDGLTGLMVEHGQRVRERDEALARADRLADRAVMLESRLAEVARILKPYEQFSGVVVFPVAQALAVAEGES